ncbi:MAG: LLM class F420-dependent oxidoreductase [Pseudomonadota bacterium]
MKLSVDFPSVSYRWGPEAVIKIAQAVESAGYDQLDMFDHVVMGHPTATRGAPQYPPQMPIMEAIVMLSFIASATKTIGLGTEVLVLPQRNPTLTAKQISTLDTLSGGRVRLGVGVGWQESEYEALSEDFHNRGKRMDEAIRLLRRFWAEESVSIDTEHYQFEAIAMEPKPPQGGNLPIWIGGASEAALKRTGELGDGWLGTAALSSDQIAKVKETIIKYAEAADRDPSKLGWQMMLDSPPRDETGKRFFADKDKVLAAAEKILEAGFEWMSINMTAVFQSGARTPEAMIDAIAEIHDYLHARFD